VPLKLTVFPAGLPGRQLVFWEGGHFVLGRSPDADLVVPDPRVSNRHLLIDGRGKTWRITDAGSKNGTRIDGRPLDRRALEASVWLNIGGVPAFAELQAREDTLADEAVRKRRRANLSAAATAMGGRLAARVLLSRCLQGLVELSGCERALVWTYGEAGQLAPLMRRGPAEPAPSRSVVETVAAGGPCCVVNDTAGAESLFRSGSIERGGIRALVVLPLETRGERLGALYADSLAPGKTFTELDVDLLLGLAAQAAVAIGLSQLRGELNRLAQFAPLTA
jgi:FHA domain/GAF domain